MTPELLKIISVYSHYMGEAVSPAKKQVYPTTHLNPTIRSN